VSSQAGSRIRKDRRAVDDRALSQEILDAGLASVKA
jgi:hypothetical protein